VIDIPNDKHELIEHEFVDIAYRPRQRCRSRAPPGDAEKLQVWKVTDDTTRSLSEKKTKSAYDECLHIGCYAFFDSCANAAVGEDLVAMPTGSTLSPEQTAAHAHIKAVIEPTTRRKEAAHTRLGFLRLIKGGQASTYTYRVFAEFAHDRLRCPHPTAVSGTLDALRQAFFDRTLKVNLYAASKAAAGGAYAKVTPNRATQDAKARKAAADKREAATFAAVTVVSNNQ
jgi:hypothetical protein